jgi:hypothetical protein
MNCSVIEIMPQYSETLNPYLKLSQYREGFYFVDQFHGFALHGDQWAFCCEAHTNFADESACLTADNIQNEIVTIHRSEEVLKMLCHYTKIFLAPFEAVCRNICNFLQIFSFRSSVRGLLL